MIARGFKSVIWVATVGSAALGCYMVSLRVATERNELAKVEQQIIEARKDIRSLQTELGTRGRMTQLEQWNAEVLALSAPSSAQFMKDEFTLARLYRNDPTVAERSAEVRLASAEEPAAKPAEAAKPAAPAVVHAVAEPAAAPPTLIHRASFASAEPKPAAVPARSIAKPPVKPDSQRIAEAAPAKPREAAARPATKPPVVAAKDGAKPGVAAAKPGTKPLTVTAKPAAKPAAIAARSETKPSASAARAASKPATAAAKPAAIAANPVREPASATRQSKAKGSGGN